jgi:hypothetical protein
MTNPQDVQENIHAGKQQVVNLKCVYKQLYTILSMRQRLASVRLCVHHRNGRPHAGSKQLKKYSTTYYHDAASIIRTVCIILHTVCKIIRTIVYLILCAVCTKIRAIRKTITGSGPVCKNKLWVKLYARVCNLLHVCVK